MLRMGVALLMAAQTGAILWLWRQKRQRDAGQQNALEDSARLLEKLQAELARTEGMRKDERRGRVSAEKELRVVMDSKLDTSNGHYVQALGTVTSCFQSCLGTPRQGSFAPSTRGQIVFHRNVAPDTLIGLEAFSHVWIVFVFHKNTNGKNARAHRGLRSDSHRHTFRAKIAPPRLKERVGIFSTRSPHRPNPIGITLATIASVDHKHRTVHITGLDLVEGTPVLDIKPYVPAYDSIPHATVATWVSSDLAPTVNTVRWTPPSLCEALCTHAASSFLYRDDPLAFQLAIEEVLQADVRSKDLTTRRQRAGDNQLHLDNVYIHYRIAPLSIESCPSSASDPLANTMCEPVIEIVRLEPMSSK